MAGDTSRLIRQLYAGALQRDPEERAEYLDRACAGRPELHAKVAALLAAHSGDFLDAPETALSPTGYLAATPEQTDERVVGPYIIRRELGRGGMGVVYLADDTRLSRRVALKVLNEQLGSEPGGRERLRREARAAAALSHPGIATVFAIEEIGDQLYIACEYVPGEPLRALMRSGPLPNAQVADIGVQLARALAAAHTAGIVHRDIKPENIVRTPSGVVKVLDFGLARVETATYQTQTGAIVGTPAYLAPEQARGQHLDFRADLFALGVVLYELTTGKNPFAASTITATIARIVEEQPPPLSQVQPGTAPGLERIVEICMQKDPLNRYQSTQELVGDLEQLVADLAEHRRSSHHAQHAYRFERDRPRWWWQVHQLSVSAIQVVMLYPSWIVRSWLAPPWGILFFLALLTATAAATSLRLHLWFVARFFPGELAPQQSWSRAPTRWCDTASAVCQVAAAVAIAGSHPEFAVLLVTVSTATLIASFVIEPATARIAFPPAAPTSSGSFPE